MSSRLAIGTVQFGLNYGVANQTGRVSREAASAILTHARVKGVDTIDTAASYGDSEKCLGEIGVSSWRVVSKLPPMPEAVEDVGEWAREEIERSLHRLQIPKLYALLVHRAKDLLQPEGDALYSALLKIKRDGLTEKIGVSIYCPLELDVLFANYGLDVVQGPFNVFDRRLETSGWLTRLRARGTEIHVRSVFLQGLLLMTPARRPPQFDRWRELWSCWELWLAGSSLTPLQACLGFVLSQPGIDRIVIGIDSVQQLCECLEIRATGTAAPPESLICQDLDLVNPSRWGRL